MATISIATIEDLENIMFFLDQHWKKSHILSINKELFLYEFQENNRLNITIAKNDEGELLGIFGFIKYNDLIVPDLAGSLWKVREDCNIPLLGLKLRDYTIKNIRHRFFAAPGAGLQTKPIYKIVKMNWNKMNHFYIVNDKSKVYNIIKINDPIHFLYETNALKQDVTIDLVKNVDELNQFDFQKFSNIVPFKDLSYIIKRFVHYPIYKYDIYTLKESGKIVNIFICRAAMYLENKAYRIVDFYGNEKRMNYISSFLYKFIVDNDYEYCDFVSFGFDTKNMKNAGFNKLDFEKEEIVVPNYFEPFLQKNIPVYCVSNKVDNLIFRQCKADGDQDRPNMVKI